MSQPTEYTPLRSSVAVAVAVAHDHRACVRQCCLVVNVRSELSHRSAAFAIATLVATVTSLSACGSDEDPSAERFCGEVAANKDALTNPQLLYDDDIDPLLGLYRRIGALAPIGVQSDWDQIISAYETASTVVVGDQESEQQALTAIYSSEKSAAAVEAWLLANCAVDIGPVFTIVPQGPITVTVPPDTAPGDTSPDDATPDDTAPASAP
jgi:hypothetical protein